MPDWSGLRSRLEAEKARLEKAFATGNSLGLETRLQDSFNELSSMTIIRLIWDQKPSAGKGPGFIRRLRIRRRNIEHAERWNGSMACVKDAGNQYRRLVLKRCRARPFALIASGRKRNCRSGDRPEESTSGRPLVGPLPTTVTMQ